MRRVYALCVVVALFPPGCCNHAGKTRVSVRPVAQIVEEVRPPVQRYRHELLRNAHARHSPKS